MPLKYKEENAIYRRDPKFYNNTEQTTQQTGFDVISENINDKISYSWSQTGAGSTSETITEDFILTEIHLHYSIDSCGLDHRASLTYNSGTFIQIPITTSLAGKLNTFVFKIPNWLIKRGSVFLLDNPEGGYMSACQLIGYRV